MTLYTTEVNKTFLLGMSPKPVSRIIPASVHCIVGILALNSIQQRRHTQRPTTEIKHIYIYIIIIEISDKVKI